MTKLPSAVKRLSLGLLILAAGCAKAPEPPTTEEILAARASSPHLERKALKPVLPDLGPIVDLPKSAAGSLAQIGPVAIPALKTALTDADPTVRRQAARALGQMGPEAEPAVAELTKALEDAAPEVREAAVQALGKIGPAAAPAIPALIKALEDDAGAVKETTPE